MELLVVLAGSILLVGLVVGLVADLKLSNQFATDQARRWYRLTLPEGSAYDQIEAFVHSLSGLHRPRGMAGIPTFVFEITADSKEIVHRLGIPSDKERFVLTQLRTMIPGTHPVKEDRPESKWDYAMELKLTDTTMPLQIAQPDKIVGTILGNFHPLKDGEALLMQWVVTPNQTMPLPLPVEGESKEHLAARRAKVVSSTFMVSGRIASRADSLTSAKRLLHNQLYNSLNTTRTHETRLVRRKWLTREWVHSRLNGTVSSFPMMLSLKEMTTLIGFPMGTMNIVGMPNGRSRQLPVNTMIPSKGIILGNGNFDGLERPLAIDPVSLRQHMHILGPTGSGKSTLLHNIVTQLIEQGFGVVVIEPKGDLAHDVLMSTVRTRSNDVIWFDPTDTSRPVGLNVLAGPDPERTTGHIVALFKNIYADSWGPRLERILRYAVLTAALRGLTLYDVKQLLLNESFRKEVVRGIKDPDIRQFWNEYEEMADNARDSVINKLDSFLGSRTIRNIIGQREGISLAEMIDSNGILLAPMVSGALGDANASMLGSLLFMLLWQEFRSRDAASRKPFYLVVDEWQTFTGTMPMDDMFAIARGLGLGLIVANQHTAQLKSSTLSAVNANARTKVAFGMAPEDARKMADQFAPLTAYDLGRLGLHEVAIQAMTPEGMAPVATATTSAPARRSGYGNEALAGSRAKYGRPVDEVEAEFAAKHVVPIKPERPRFRERPS